MREGACHAHCCVWQEESDCGVFVVVLHKSTLHQDLKWQSFDVARGQKSQDEQKKEEDNKKEEEDLQNLLASNMVQTIPTMSVIRNKSVTELVNEESESESDISDSAFFKRPFKKAKKTKAKKLQKEKNSKVEDPVAEMAEHLSVASSVSNPEKMKLMAQARKPLEGRNILYPC
eukprot:2411917-Ditylum_brightwellii.AAC.1